MRKGQCKFCGIELKDKANIRCDKCDVIWQTGYREGVNSIRLKLSEIFNAVKNLGTVD